MLKKIYLVDDDRDQQREKYYNADYIVDGRYASTLVNIDKILPNDSSQYKQNFLTAAAVLIHKTFPNFTDAGDRVENNSYIQELISELEGKVPLCVFSYSMQNAVFDHTKNANYIAQLNKRVFYAHLEDFLLQYQDQGTIDFRILVKGKNFQAQEAKPYYNIIYQKLIQRPARETFDPLAVYEELETFYRHTSSTLSFEDFIFDLQDHPLSIEAFLNLLNKIYNSLLKYGKNIYH